MIWVLCSTGLIWIGGHFGGLSIARRWQLSLLLVGVVLLSHLVLPEGAAIRGVLGGDFTTWAVGFGVIGLGLFYARVVSWIKARVPEAPSAEGDESLFSDAELNRYARHIVLHEIGGSGQVALKNGRVLVVGAGGLGSPILLYLAAAGVGTIGVIDDDVVENSNLQRQVIHRDADIKTPKVYSAQRAMLAQNPAINVLPYNRRLTADIAEDLMSQYDLVIEGSDNFETRYLVNSVAAKLQIPMIGGALSQWEGQISVFDPANGTACYQCVFPKAPKAGLAPNCSQAGVVGPLPGVIGSMMALEAIKELSSAGESLRGKLLIYDALYCETRIIKLSKTKGCPCCG